jgi:fluoride exporter
LAPESNVLAYLAHPCVLLLVGGGLGANARYWLGEWFKARHWSDAFPWHTFAINVVGSFVLGLVAATCKDRPAWQLLLGVGVCGGFTTFSTFSVEVLAMIEKDRLLAAAGYAVGSVVAGVMGAALAMRCASH